MDQELRPELAAFAKVMESRLKENAHRGDWRSYNFYYLAACLTANLGHMIRAYQAESELIGETPSEELFNHAARIASQEAAPIDDLRASADFRRHLIKVYTIRALRQALMRTKENHGI